MSRRPRADAGFTLLEVIIALTVLALMSVILFGSFRFGQRAWDTTADASEQLQELSAVRGLLRRAIEGIEPRRQIIGTSAMSSGLIGELDRLEFTSVGQGIGGFHGLQRMQIRFETGNGPGALFIAWRPEELGESESGFSSVGEEEIVERRLLGRVKKAEFRYFGSLDGEKEPEWYESWHSEDRLPDLIQIAVGFQAGARLSWPPLFISPRAQTMSLSPQR